MKEPSDNQFRAVLFARIPEQLDDQQRRRKYDEPLIAALREAPGAARYLRGVSFGGDEGKIAWVGIEVELFAVESGSFVSEHLVRLGAPPETQIEIETDEASLELSLAEIAGA